MNWRVAVACGFFFLGIAAGGYIVAQQPTFWIEIGARLGDLAWPYVREYVLRRNSEEIELKMKTCVRRGGEWDNFRKVCRS